MERYCLDTELNRAIETAYKKYWGYTDLNRYGDSRSAKHKQNIASAKSALDRTGQVIKFESDGKIYRVKLDWFVINAFKDWNNRTIKKKKKKKYKRLDQPKEVYLVPR